MPLESDTPTRAAGSPQTPARNSLALLDGWTQLPEILDGISDGIVTVDRSWRITFVNNAVARLLGRTRSQLLGKLLWDEVRELRDTSFGRAFVQAMTESVPLTLEDHFAPLSLWLEARAFPTPAGVTVLLRDMTARKQAEQRAARRALQLKGLTEAAVLLSDADSLDERLLRCAEQARQIVGAHGALTSLSHSGLWEDAHHAPAASGFRPFDVNGFISAGEQLCPIVAHYGGAIRLTSYALETHPAFVPLRTGQQPLPSGWLAAPVTGRDGRQLGLIQLWDKEGGEFDEEDEHLLMQLAQMASVSLENARLVDEAHEHTRRAEAANRIKDEFLATVSHELRTPLTSILGWTQMLRTRAYSAEKRERGLEIVERNARALRQIVEDLLDVSRIISGKMRLELAEVEPHRPVEAALDSVRPTATAKGVHLRAELDAGVGVLMADSARLQQVTWNLLVNAVKFTPPGKSVEVTLGLDEGELVLSVKDEGEGIQPDFLPQLFQRFRQADGSTSRIHGGLGLGLSIVRHLVELHGGTVCAQSDGLGCGSTFQVRLPAPRRSTPAGSEDATERLAAGRLSRYPAQPLHGLSVLVVDDSHDSREFIGNALEEAGADVLYAESAAEAFDLLREHRPGLLITDIGMPGEDGFQLLDRIRHLPPSEGGLTPAVALTAYARAEDKEHAMLAGFQMHVSKPLDADEVIAAVAEAAGRTVTRGT